MLFNSYAFIFLFVPITFTVYFALNRRRLALAAKTWLVFASLFFYGYWNPVYIPLILGSILFNYAVASILIRRRGRSTPSRWMLLVGIAGNLFLLAFFKYMDFFITNINAVSSLNLKLLHITLPLGISFFTFTQIAYLVDTARGAAREYSLLNYSLFVTFFPHLLAGPIIHHKEIMPQFDYLRNKILSHKHIAQGLALFFLGLFKKVVIADALAGWANAGFDVAPSLGLIEAWLTSLSYTLQLYYDFSGYTDMALGASLLFNIKLPINFNSPYKSLTLQEFWHRWHITLGRFFRDYIYIPVGGSWVREPRLLLNILVTFFLVGLWHGAGWTFVIWGLLHGIGLVIFHLWQKTPFRFPRFVSWAITFNFVNAAWVFFRARTFPDAMKVLKGMAGFTGVTLPEGLVPHLATVKQYGVKFGEMLTTIGWNERTLCTFIVFFLVAIFLRNSNEMGERLRPTWRTAGVLSVISLYAISHLQKTSEFIYFNF
jgi:D-alanyl-lipoteichoic acid acyltransferase DltB (MBOAT superfamily)